MHAIELNLHVPHRSCLTRHAIDCNNEHLFILRFGVEYCGVLKHDHVFITSLQSQKMTPQTKDLHRFFIKLGPRMKLTTRRLLLLIALISVSIAIVANRANQQRKATRVIEELGATVMFRDNLNFLGKTIGHGIENSHRTTFHVRNSATAVRLSFHQYDHEMEQQLRKLRRLRRIEVRGHDDIFGAGKIRYDFPLLDVDSGPRFDDL